MGRLWIHPIHWLDFLVPPLPCWMTGSQQPWRPCYLVGNEKDGGHLTCIGRTTSFPTWSRLWTERSTWIVRCLVQRDGNQSRVNVREWPTKINRFCQFGLALSPACQVNYKISAIIVRGFHSSTLDLMTLPVVVLSNVTSVQLVLLSEALDLGHLYCCLKMHHKYLK